MLVRRTDAGRVRVRGARLSLRDRLAGVPDDRHPRRRAAARPDCVESVATRPRRSSRPPPRRRRATTRTSPFGRMSSRSWAPSWPTGCATSSLAIYQARARLRRESRGIIIADTKFEFGIDADGTLLPDRRGADARFVAVLARGRYAPGRTPAQLRQAAAARLSRRRCERPASGTAKRRPPAAPAEVVDATSAPIPRSVPAAHRPRAPESA